MEDLNVPAGDLEIEVVCEQEFVMEGIFFRREGQNIIAEVEISLKEALAGFVKTITLPDGIGVEVAKVGLT